MEYSIFLTQFIYHNVKNVTTWAAYSREIKSVRFKADISKHAGFNMTGYFAGLDIHGSSVDLDPGISSIVHRFIQSSVKSDLWA